MQNDSCYLIGTDIGTSGTKTIIMDTGGNLIASDLQEYSVLTPKALWAEQWPDVWLEAVKKSIKGAVVKAGVDVSKIKGMCISGLYGGSGIPVDKNMEPVRPCLIWMDRRAGAEQEWVKRNIDRDLLYRITGNGTDPYYGYTKILWIKNNEPENWGKIHLFLPPNAYVIYKFTNEIAIDYSSAGNIGGIFDITKRRWSDEMLDAMGIPKRMMPERIVESQDIVGVLTPEAARELTLPEGIPVCAGDVDCAVATLGMGVFSPGMYTAAIGTSMCAALIHEKSLSVQNLITMPYVYKPNELLYSFSGGATAGAILSWFRDNFAELEKINQKETGESAYSVLDKQAEKIPVGSEGLVVLPYFMGERSPIWDKDARGNILGLSLNHTKVHIYRAFLEAVAFSLRHSMEATGEDLGTRITLAGGVTKSKLWIQIFADVTGCEIVYPTNDVEANLGDVILAGIGTGVLTYDDVKKWQMLSENVTPNIEAHERYNEMYKIYRSTYEHLKKDMHALNDIG